LGEGPSVQNPGKTEETGKRQYIDTTKLGVSSSLSWQGCLKGRYSPTVTGMSRYDRPSHTVYMYFFLRTGWQVQFLEADLKTALPRKFTFTHPEKIRDLASRGEA
jgi:hypothetical protein